MSESHFHFKQFTIHQNLPVMKVGTDSVILGAWATTTSATHVLDIGTGTGLLAIMIAQRLVAQIDAIDIDMQACKQATVNANLSPWGERINVVHTSLQDFAHVNSQTYDLIVSNPPFFVDAYKARHEERNMARHTDNYLSFEELVSGVLKLLTENGRFCVVLPYTEGLAFRQIALRSGLFCTRFVRVVTRKGKHEKRILMEFSKIESGNETGELVILDRNLCYSEEYLKLTEDFYKGLGKSRVNGTKKKTTL